MPKSQYSIISQYCACALCSKITSGVASLFLAQLRYGILTPRIADQAVSEEY